MFLALALVACTPDPSADPIVPYDPLQYVDPFVATGGIGAQVTAVTPGASAPLGMVLVGPNTRSSTLGEPGFYHLAGYHHDDDRIDGFAHTHAYGMGINDYGAVHVMPRAAWADDLRNERARMAPFSHDAEEASPGRYAVTLQDDGTRVEIVASPRGAIHRYTFRDGAEPIVLFDLAHTLGDVRIDEADLQIDVAANEIVGFQRLSGGYSGRFGGVLTHFVASFDPPIAASGTWDGAGTVVPGSTGASGVGIGGWVGFPPGTTEVRMRIAISYVDHDGARRNLEAEHPDFDVEARLSEVEASWRELLSRVRVRGGTEGERITFHTALYHSLLMPSRFSDVDGRYRGVDQEVHTADFDYLTDLSLWDTFRTLHPLWILAWPEHQRSTLKSLIQMGRDGGSLARWPLGHGYTGGMVGTPAQQLFAGSYLKGLDDGWDVEEAFDLAYAAAVGPQDHAGRGGIEAYLDLGYVPVEVEGAAASKTLEYAWSDHAMARWADALGREEEAAILWEQAGNWENTWSDEWGFFVGRHADGSFTWEEARPFAWLEEYTEGNAWHYLWTVPYDVPGMIEVQHGGDVDAFLDRYAAYWDEVYAEEDDLLPDDYYWHGNEPVLHYAFLGSLAGAPALTAEASRWVMENRYGPTPLGLDGNDDSGTLSAWYVFAAMGVFPVAGTDVYAIGSPLFERIEIDREDGDPLVVRTIGEGIYVRSASLGDTPLSEASFRHGDWIRAGDLVLEMSRDRAAWDGR